MTDFTDDRAQRTGTVESLHGTEGRLLDDRFRVEELLGQNRLTTTWRCHDVQLDRQVVIRMAHRHVLTDRAAMRRHRQEALAAAAFTHPHLVGQYDAVIREDCAYTVTEFVPGPDLALVFELLPLAAEEVAAIGAQIASALAAAHDLDIVHRGVEPRRVLLGIDGRTRLTDLAAARLPLGGDGGIGGRATAERGDRSATDADDVRDLAVALSSARLAPRGADGADRSMVGRVMRRFLDTSGTDESSDRLRQLLELAGHALPSVRPSAALLTDRFRDLCDGRTDEILRGVVARLEAQGVSW